MFDAETTAILGLLCMLAMFVWKPTKETGIAALLLYLLLLLT